MCIWAAFEIRENVRRVNDLTPLAGSLIWFSASRIRMR